MKTIEWRVTWFPSGPDRQLPAHNEEAAKKLADKHADEFPIIESRVVEVGPWRTEANYAQFEVDESEGLHDELPLGYSEEAQALGYEGDG